MSEDYTRLTEEEKTNVKHYLSQLEDYGKKTKPLFDEANIKPLFPEIFEQACEDFARDFDREFIRRITNLLKDTTDDTKKGELVAEAELETKPSVELHFQAKTDPHELVFYACRDNENNYYDFGVDRGHGGGGLFGYPTVFSANVLFKDKSSLEYNILNAFGIPKDKCGIVEIRATLEYKQHE